jgi:hypothetical protein
MMVSSSDWGTWTVSQKNKVKHATELGRGREGCKVESKLGVGRKKQRGRGA